MRSRVQIIIAGHLLARSHALKKGQIGVKRKKRGEIRTKIMAMEIRKTEMKGTTNKTKRNGTKMKKMKNMNLKKTVKGDKSKENKETMNMKKKTLEIVLGRAVKGEGNKTRLTQTDPEKMKSLIGKEEMNIRMNILKMKKAIESRKDKTKKGGIGRIQMVKREMEKEKSKEKDIWKMIRVKRGTKKEINRDKTEEGKMKEIKKVKVLKVKTTETKGTDEERIREKELTCMMNMQEKMIIIRREKEIVKMAARSKKVEETNMIMKEDKIVEEIKINQSV